MRSLPYVGQIMAERVAGPVRTVTERDRDMARWAVRVFGEDFIRRSLRRELGRHLGWGAIVGLSLALDSPWPWTLTLAAHLLWAIKRGTEHEQNVQSLEPGRG